MQLLPAFAQAPDHSGAGCDRQRNHYDECGKSRRDVGAFDDIFANRFEIKK